jgi:hypothetical protein
MGQEPDQLRADIERTRAELDRDVDALTEKVSPGRIVDRRVQRTKGTVRSWKDRVMGSAGGAAGSVGDTASNTAEGASNAVQSAAGTVQERTQGNPLAAGVIAFGVGWLASSLIPASRVEEQAGGKVRELASEHGDTVAQPVKQAASDVAEQMKEPAREAAQSVQQTAREGAQHVTDEGRSQAQDARQVHTSG